MRGLWSDRTRRNDIVHHQHSLARLHSTRLHLEVVLAILLLIGLRLTWTGQLALLAHRDEAGTDSQGQAGAEEEASCLKTDNHIGFLVLAVGLDDVQLQASGQSLVQGGVREDGHDILEQDARGGEVGELAQRIAQSYFKTGEFGGAGGMGGGLSDLGGGGIWFTGGRMLGGGRHGEEEEEEEKKGERGRRRMGEEIKIK